MPVTFSSYRLGPGQRVSNKTVPPPWDWLLRRENELGPRRSKSRIIFAVLVPPLYVAVQAPALIVTLGGENESEKAFLGTEGSLYAFLWYSENVLLFQFLFAWLLLN